MGMKMRVLDHPFLTSLHLIESASTEVYLFNLDDLRVLYASEAALKELCADRESCLDTSFDKISSGIDKAELMAKMRDMQGSLVNCVEFKSRHRRQDGTHYPVSCKMQLYDENTCILAAHKTLNQSSSAATSKFEEIADNAPVLIWISGLDKLCYYFNKPWLEFTGRSLEQEAGNGWAEGVHPDDFDQCLKTYSESFEKRIPFQMEYRLKRHDGVYLWILDKGVPRMSPKEGFLGYIGSCVDIHEMRLAREEAEHSNRCKGQFLAMMSHEIRTPLNGVIGMASLILGDKLDREQREILEIVKQSGESLMVILNDILDFSKIDSGRLSLDVVSFDLKMCVQQTLELFRKQTREKGISLKLDFPKKMPQFIQGDPNRLRQILTNLISNAVKFTEKGSICLSVSRVKESLDGGSSTFRFVISDTGIGIPSDKLDVLLNPFEQLDSSIRRKYGGTGLGLAICRSLIGHMGGDLKVQSSIGKGSEFSFSLPLVVCQRVAQLESLQPHNDREMRPMDPLKVLIAEDNLINRKVAELNLLKLGLKADSVLNGQQAVLAAAQNCYDLIFMDVQMPHMDGIEATKVIREICGQQPYILAMTAGAMENERQVCFEAGMNDFLSKPYREADFRSIFSKYLVSRGRAKRQQNQQTTQGDSHQSRELAFRGTPTVARSVP